MKFPIIAKHANSVAAITPSSNLVKPRQTSPTSHTVRTGKLESGISVDWAHLPSTRKVLPSQCSARLGLQLVLPRTYGLTTPTYTRTKSSILGGARQDFLPALPLAVVLVVVLVQVLGVVPPADGLPPAKLRVLPVWVILSDRSAWFWRFTTPLGGEANAHTPLHKRNATRVLVQYGQWYRCMGVPQGSHKMRLEQGNFWKKKFSEPKRKLGSFARPDLTHRKRYKRW